MQKKQLTLVVVSLLVVVLSVSLAWFTTQILGKGKDVNVSSANLQIIFTDSDGAISDNDIEPGWSVTKTFTVQNNSKSEYKYNIVIKDLVNTFTLDYLKYKITSTNGYNMTDYELVPKSAIATDKILAKNVTIGKGVTQTYTIEFTYPNDEDVDQSADMNKKLSGTLFITEGSGTTLAEKLLENNPTISERTDFTIPFTSNTVNTLYKAKEENIDVYYFAGQDTENTPIKNWIKFGKQKQSVCTYNGQQVSIGIYNNGPERIDKVNQIENESECTGTNICVTTEFGPVIGVTQSECSDTSGQWITAIPTYGGIEYLDLYWRIIRTNADGSVRLLYHGTSTTATDAYIGTSKFNSKYSDPMYVGYMYGKSNSTEIDRSNTNNSAIKGVIDNWYKDNLNTNYGKYISTTAIYCNDRSNPTGGYNTGSATFYYGGYTRLITNKAPTYDCTNTNDKFTLDSSTGNGKLTYPVALMTADEISYAGGVYNTAAPMWYYTNSSLESSTSAQWWWLLSPRYWYGGYAYVFGVFGSSNPGRLDNYYASLTYGVRPVISLKSCVKTSGGDGSADNPYTILETATGC